SAFEETIGIPGGRSATDGDGGLTRGVEHHRQQHLVIAVVTPKVLRREVDGDSFDFQIQKDFVAVQTHGGSEAVGVWKQQQAGAEPSAAPDFGEMELVAYERQHHRRKRQMPLSSPPWPKSRPNPLRFCYYFFGSFTSLLSCFGPSFMSRARGDVGGMLSRHM